MTDWRWSHAVLLGAVVVAPGAGAQQRVEIPDTERHVLPSAFVDEEFKIYTYLPRWGTPNGSRASCETS